MNKTTVNWKSSVDWKGLCHYIIDNGNLPDTQTSEKMYHLPFFAWFEIASKNLSSETLIRNAKNVLVHYKN